MKQKLRDTGTPHIQTSTNPWNPAGRDAYSSSSYTSLNLSAHLRIVNRCLSRRKRGFRRDSVFSSPYTFSAKERDLETGYSYFGARYYDATLSVWLSVDPLSDKYPSMSAFMYCAGNPLILVDPDGADPGIFRGGIGFNFIANLSGGYSIGVSMGVNYRQGAIMVGLNQSIRVYNYGLGTTHGSTGTYSQQTDAVTSVSVTIGKNDGSPLPLNTFNNNSPTGVFNDFGSSATLATNIVKNSDDRDQTVGYLGGRSGNTALNFYNDWVPALGDEYDRFWTGGGSIQMATDHGLFMIGTDVFTGLPFDDGTGGFLMDPLNSAGGRWGTYDQDSYNRSLNNGQTLSVLPASGGVTVNRQGGASHMYSQNLIHNVVKRPLFYSTAYE